MTSCLHTWNLDPSTDEVCIERLGLLKPIKPVSFGLLTREGRISMVLPGWYDEISIQRSKMEVVNLLDDSPINIENYPANEIEDSNGTGITTRLCYRSHWLMSSALSTLHLVGLVSVANTLMSMNQVSFVVEEKRVQLLTSSTLDVKSSSSSYSDGEDDTAVEGLCMDVFIQLLHFRHEMIVV